MRTPAWKVAVVSGSVAALGLGGFAAAQSSDGSGRPTPELIRLQQDISASAPGVDSVNGVGQASIASVDSSPSVASVSSVDSPDSSVPAVGPPPVRVPGGAPATLADDSVDSPASLDSPDSVDSSD